MKKTTMQRTLALMTAALTAVTLTGCGKGGGQKGSTLEISFDNSYSAQKIETDNYDIGGFFSAGDKLVMIGFDQDYKSQTMLYDPASSALTPLELEYAKQATDERMIDVMGIFASKDGGINVIYSDYTVDENWEFLTQVYYMESYDSSMKLTGGRDITEHFPENTYYYNLMADSSGNVYAIANDDEGMQYISVRNSDFEEIGIAELDVEWIDSVFCGKDGSVYASGYSNMGGQIFGKIDPESLLMEEVDVDGIPEYYNGVFAGSGDYDFYFYDSQSVSGVKLADGICEEVVNWINSDFSGDYVNSVAALPDGRFLTSMYNSEYDGSTLWLMEERSPEELENMEIISLATLYSDTNLMDAVCEYNRANDDIRIVVKDYSSEVTDEEWEASIDNFSKDMTSGKVADIICTQGLNFESYANKGMFVDLYSLMEQDPEFKREDYLENFFKSLEYKDQLQRISFSYYIETIAGKTEYVGDKMGITPQEFIDLLKNVPKDMDPFPNMTKSSALYSMCMGNMGTFIDTVNATCHFDDPQFIEFLELCNTYPADDSIDYDNMSEDDWTLYWQAEEMAFRNDTALLKQVYIDAPRMMHTVLMGDFATEDVTFIGFPTSSEEGNGGVFNPSFNIAVSSQSKYQEQIWEFIKYMLSEEYQKTLEWTFPVHKGALRSMMDETVNTKEEYDKYYYLGNEEFDIGYPTQEEMDRLMTYLEGISQSVFYDVSVYEIIDEEAGMFFSGDQTAEQAASMIQSRVSLYLSEQS